MKKYLSLLACVLIICTVLTGCGLVLIPSFMVGSRYETQVVESVAFLDADLDESEYFSDIINDSSDTQPLEGNEEVSTEAQGINTVDSGLTIIEVTDQNVYQYEKYDIETTGVIIIESLNTSELKCGDKVTHVNVIEISCADDIETILQSCKAGDVVIVTVERGGKAINVELTLTEKVPDYVNFE